MPTSASVDLTSYDTAAFQQLFRYAEDIKLLLKRNKERHAENQLDNVTGLPTWDVLAAQAGRVLAVRQCEAKPLLLVLSVRRLREINGALGRETGDRVLRHVADTLRGAIREDDRLARLGGPEFVIVSQMDVCSAERLVAHVQATPVILDGQEICAELSVGGAYLSSGAPDFSAALRKASIALGFAKNYLLRRTCMYTPSMESTCSRENMTIEADLWHAVQRGEFNLLYQPQVNTKNCSLAGVEALLRWEHPVFGNIIPSRFIPIAERNGAIVSIGAWVVRKACEQLRDWKVQGLGNITMAVNISPQQLKSETFLGVLRTALHENRISPESLELEVTESEIMSAYGQAKGILDQVHDLGIRIAVDDFGTGHSNLSRLKDIPINRLKIDRSLICDIETDTRAQAVVSCIMNLSSALDIDVVVEGVESNGQLEQLQKHGCHIVQGFLFGRPMRPEDFSEEAFQGYPHLLVQNTVIGFPHL